MTVLEVFWAPERGQHRTQEAPKTLSGPGSRWTSFRVSFFACFGTPWDLGNGAPMQAGARFSENQLFELGASKGPQNAAQNDPKRAPGGSQSGKMDGQSRCLILGGFSSRFSTILGIPKGPPGHPKMSQKRVKSQTRLRGASGGSFWSHCGFILEPPGVHFRASGGRFSNVRGHFLIPLWSSSSSSFSALPLSPLFFLFVLLRLCWNFGTFSRTIFGALSGASSRPALAEIPAQTAERGRGARPRSLTRMLSGSAGCAGPSCSLLIRSLASGILQCFPAIAALCSA